MNVPAEKVELYKLLMGRNPEPGESLNIISIDDGDRPNEKKTGSQQPALSDLSAPQRT